MIKIIKFRLRNLDNYGYLMFSHSFKYDFFIVCTQLNGFTSGYLLFAHSQMVSSMAIYCLHTVKWFQVLLSNTNSSICHN